VALLDVLEKSLRQGGARSLIFFAGDSSLDNKAWVNVSTEPPVNGMEEHLDFSVKDVAHMMNKEILARKLGDEFAVLNCAVEATTLRSRKNRLLRQDEFIRSRITSEDILVVSVGGNDIAMSPKISTVFYMLWIAWIARLSNIESGTALGMSTFLKLFKDHVRTYIEKLIAVKKPKKILVCMIYFPSEKRVPSWANLSLSAMRYGSHPEKVQSAIRHLFEEGTCNIEIDGVEIVPVPLFQLLDPQNSDHFEQRVEPSVKGGHAMSCGILDLIFASSSSQMGHE